MGTVSSGVDLATLVGIGVMGLAGVAIALLSTKSGRQAMYRAPISTIRDAPEGKNVTVAGVARALAEPLLAPLSRRPCILYKVVVTDDDKFRKVLEERVGSPFAIDDGTGRAWVDPQFATLRLNVDYERKSGTFDAATDEERALLARHGSSPTGLVFNRKLHYRESIIAVGDRVTVYGSGVREPDPEAPPNPSYRGPAATRLRLSGTEKHRLSILDS